MSKNIYDLFNERKNGIDCLVEGYDFNIDRDAEFEDLDAAMEALDQITLESTNEMLEFRAAGYLEDLVLENMMFEDFDEERILHVMEAAKEEKKAGLGQKIKNLWEKIKQWFVGAFKAIANHFASGEQLVLKYKKEIPAAIAQAKGKVKMRQPRKFAEATANVQKKVENLRAKGKSKQDILDSIGVRDLKEIGGMVDSLYYISKEKKEVAIKELNAQKLMDWAGNKKVYMDSLKKDQTETDKKFKEMLEEIKREGAGKEGDAAAKVAEDAANFQFGITALNIVLFLLKTLSIHFRHFLLLLQATQWYCHYRLFLLVCRNMFCKLVLLMMIEEDKKDSIKTKKYSVLKLLLKCLEINYTIKEKKTNQVVCLEKLMQKEHMMLIKTMIMENKDQNITEIERKRKMKKLTKVGNL